MMKSLYCILFVSVVFSTVSYANNYATPGTGVRWNLDDLVSHAGGDVSFSAGAYNVNDTVFISQYDTLYITSDATVKFALNSYLDVNGTLIVNPPAGVLFTAQNIAGGYYGMRIDSSNTTVLRKLTFEYAVSLRVSDCNILIDNCIFQYNSPTTNFGNGAISLFRASPVITNCQFLNNQRAAIQGGANINNAPKIIGCLFRGNNTLNTNVPQINLGATSDGADTVKIINNQILRASTNSGGIGFLPIGNVYAVITGNVIKNNRYGLTFNGGANINALIGYNQIDSNNTQGDPNLGGSGISFLGGSATSHQNSVVTGNLLRWNLWGVTIQGRAKPNLGNTSNTDTSDDGKNRFSGNTNATTPFIDLYNNTADPIDAQNNYWGTNDLSAVEAKIFHQPDNPALGLVSYTGYILLPVKLTAFSAHAGNGVAYLTWQTAAGDNSAFFGPERSTDGQSFSLIGSVTAGSRVYKFTDSSMPHEGRMVFYRLKMVDKDGKISYSPVITIAFDVGVNSPMVKLYPTIAGVSDILHVSVMNAAKQTIRMVLYDAGGRQIMQASKTIGEGSSAFGFRPESPLPEGMVYIVFLLNGYRQTVPVLIRR